MKSASYLDLHLEIDGKAKPLSKLYDKGDDFSFRIVNFPFIRGNIPLAPVYLVFISQLVRYARAGAERMLPQMRGKLTMRNENLKLFFLYRYV